MNLPAKLRSRVITSMRPGDSIVERTVTQNPDLPKVVIETNIATYNPLNGGSHSKGRQVQAAKRKRVRAQARAWIMDQKSVPALPVSVHLCRLSRGTLDEWDGLPASLKAVIDGISDAYGLNDSDPRFMWLKPSQEKAKAFGVRITIEARRES